MDMSIITSIALLAVFALIGGAIMLFRKEGMRKQAVLMVVAALVLFGNILIWTTPIAS
jgi:hypothetical protein